MPEHNLPPWAAQIYWFLRPFDAVINHLSLWSEPEDHALPAWLKAGAGYNDYIDTFRLAQPGLQLSPGAPKIDGWADDLSQLQDQLRQRFQFLGTAAQSLACMYPQLKTDCNLLASKLWSDNASSLIDDGQFTNVHDKLEALAKPRFNVREAFYVYSDLHILEAQHQMANARAIRRLIRLKGLEDVLAAKTVSGTLPRFVVGSFFADGIPDYVVFFPVSKHHGVSETTNQLLAQVTQYLQPLVFQERRSFLYRWINRLRSRIDIDGVIEDPACEGSLSRITMMVTAILYREADDGHVKKWASGLLGILKDRNSGFDAALQIANDDELAKSLKIQDRLRSTYVGDFLRDALRVMLGLRDARNRGKLKGTFSIPTTEKLAAAAQFGCKRLLLSGDPGGGKGTAAADFHLFRMEHIATNDEAKRDWLSSITKSLASLFGIPSVRNQDGDDAHTKAFVGQLEGTNWKSWSTAPQGFPDCKASLKKLECLKNPTCEFYTKYSKGIVDDLGEAPVHETTRTCILGYLCCLNAQLENLKNPEAVAGFNFVQIACGALAGEGTPLLATLDRLFGRADDAALKPTPGLFQKCSYFGGTLFLDEAADAPIAVQDNLLTALQEEEVSRRGWETVSEKISSIAVVSATHKDLRREVRLYRDTSTSGNPAGFRPDLLTRLAQYPPIKVRPLSDYFIYDEANEKAGAQRDDQRHQFVTILSGDTDRVFWERVYDYVDTRVKQMSHGMRFSGLDSIESQKRIAGALSMRLFEALKDIRKSARDPEKSDGFIFDEYLPDMLDYLATAE